MLENNNNNIKNDKVAIVTGASSGIRVAAGARRIERLQELEQQIVKNHDEGGKEVGVAEEEEIFIWQKLDVSDWDDHDLTKIAVEKPQLIR
jgi:NADP-dependent 3-hydroxy acid dehydrogenase YdfG